MQICTAVFTHLKNSYVGQEGEGGEGGKGERAVATTLLFFEFLQALF